ncbi:hypothetical protein Ahy_A04g021468 [Arachis hypogaea]|uniref:Uncharacterized protein n=1 Tax=Arachis hypogaea TaxID=3818 RepID=A0A445DKI6_ARAHY|nr:hypothetical protein Ahy_A04g021468 [Arachis hypogaea]
MSYTQRLDHFNYKPKNYITFKQRYVIDFKNRVVLNWRHPFFRFNTEIYLEDGIVTAGFLKDNIFHFGIMENHFQMNHTKKLREIQVLAYYATILLNIKKVLKAHDCSIIVYGDSYNVTSSVPILYFNGVTHNMDIFILYPKILGSSHGPCNGPRTSVRSTLVASRGGNGAGLCSSDPVLPYNNLDRTRPTSIRE